VKAALYTPVVLSLIVLGAHFMRYGNTILVGAAVVLISSSVRWSGFTRSTDWCK
jgi:hypothetical protein